MQPPRHPISCPMCQGQIETGFVSVHGTALGFFFVGMSYQNCYFKPNAKKEEKVLGSRGRRAGFRCTTCGFVGMYGPESVL